MTEPTRAGYLQFLRSNVGVPISALPNNSVWIDATLNFGLTVTNQALIVVGTADPAYPTYYTLAVYNLSADRLVRYAQDIPPSTFFADLRKTLKLGTFVTGFVNSAGDQGTSMGTQILDSLMGLSIGQLQLTQTPWGVEYLGLASAYGPAVWGIS